MEAEAEAVSQEVGDVDRGQTVDVEAEGEADNDDSSFSAEQDEEQPVDLAAYAAANAASGTRPLRPLRDEPLEDAALEAFGGSDGEAETAAAATGKGGGGGGGGTVRKRLRGQREGKPVESPGSPITVDD